MRQTLSLPSALALLATLAIGGLVGCASSSSEVERTRPTAESISPISGMTLSGEVVSVTDDALVVRTATGTETIQLQDDTRMHGIVAAGDQVMVDFNRNATGVAIATEIRMVPTASEADDM